MGYGSTKVSKFVTGQKMFRNVPTPHRHQNLLQSPLRPPLQLLLQLLLQPQLQLLHQSRVRISGIIAQEHLPSAWKKTSPPFTVGRVAVAVTMISSLISLKFIDNILCFEDLW